MQRADEPLREIDRYATWLLSKATKNGDCLECHFKSRTNGYAKLRDGEFAHRFICEQINGPIPEGMVVLHSCDNRLCINPQHLSPGTIQDNIDDMINKGRHYNKGRKRKISQDDLIEMRILRLQGWTYEAIGQEFNTSKHTAYQYLTGGRDATSR